MADRGLNDSLLGRSILDVGPASLIYDTVTGGDSLDLGETDQSSLKLETAYGDLLTSQNGTLAKDQFVSGQRAVLAIGMAEATLDKLELVLPGLEVIRDTDGNPLYYSWASVIGQRASSKEKQLTLLAWVDGIVSDDPLDITDFWRASPVTSEIESIFNADGQRFFKVMFICQKDTTQLDSLGRPTFFKSREKSYS